VQRKPSEGPQKKPAVEDGDGTPALPVGIAGFAEVKAGKVATGLKPHPTDGLSWLKAQGYRTVVHVLPPGESDSADRRLVEKAGMKYVAIEVSAATLTREVADRFNRTVGDRKAQPLFVYDRDGKLAGAMWYLYSRLVDGAGEDVARSRAANLGFKDDDSEEYRALWTAAQAVAPRR
jgi:protein tyrosine phosphatase (PTP) superfamily phosphohydrolase (DUF442 family)